MMRSRGLSLLLLILSVTNQNVEATRSKSIAAMSEFHSKTILPTRTTFVKHKSRKTTKKAEVSPSQTTLDTACQLRAGACSDTDASMFVKVGLSAALETLCLLGVFYIGKEIDENAPIKAVGGIPISYWFSILVVVFGSSFFGSFVDGGISAASDQALDPNAVPGDPNWYAKLKKPSWNPPGWVFPIMWLIVSKPTQAVALSKLLKTESIPWGVLAVYCAHLTLGDAWNKVFFGFQCTGKGAAVISVFFGLLLTSAYLFYGVDPQAGLFLLPTCGWVLVASALNWNIYLNN